MANESFPNDDHNNRVVTLAEHEQIAVGIGGLSGLLDYDGGSALFADGTGLNVKIPSGKKASIRGTRFNNSLTTTVPIGTNTSGKTRIDLVVFRLRRQETSLGAGDQYTIVPAVIPGTPGDNPVAPAAVRAATPGAGFWDIPVGEVTVAHNATSITNAQIKLRGYWITGSGYTGRDDWGKPPVEPGVLFRANDSGITYIGTNDGTWQVLYDDSGWVDVPLMAGWSTSTTGRCRVRRINGVAHLVLDLFRTGNDLTSGSVAVATLPAGFQPDEWHIVTGAVTGAGGLARFVIDTTRTIRVDNFTAIAKGSAISMATSWPLAV